MPARSTPPALSDVKFVGFDRSGHTWVGHDDEVMADILELLDPPGGP
jgi:hypothetical protein